MAVFQVTVPRTDSPKRTYCCRILLCASRDVGSLNLGSVGKGKPLTETHHQFMKGEP